MSELTLQSLTITEYLRSGASAIEGIPEVPAIYLWTLDYTRIARLTTERAIAEIMRLPRAATRLFPGRAEPFYALTVQDAPPGLGPDREKKLQELIRREDPRLGEILSYLTCLQRPLYVGQAQNLRSRFRTHMKSGSIFRTYLTEAGIEVEECALLYLEISPALGPSSHPPHEPDDLEDPESAANDGPALDVLEALLQRTSRPLLGRRLE